MMPDSSLIFFNQPLSHPSTSLLLVLLPVLVPIARVTCHTQAHTPALLSRSPSSASAGELGVGSLPGWTTPLRSSWPTGHSRKESGGPRLTPTDLTHVWPGAWKQTRRHPPRTGTLHA